MFDPTKNVLPGSERPQDGLKLEPALFLAFSVSQPEFAAGMAAGSIDLSSSAVRGLRALHDAGYRIFVVCTVRDGYPDGTDGAMLEKWYRNGLDAVEIPLTAFYGSVTPIGRNSDAVASGRRTDAILRAAMEHAIDLDRSWVVGELLDEIEAGRRAGCGTILLDNGSEPSWNLASGRVPDLIVTGIDIAAESLVCADDD